MAICSSEIDRGPPKVAEAGAMRVLAVPPGLVETETDLQRGRGCM